MREEPQHNPFHKTHCRAPIFFALLPCFLPSLLLFLLLSSSYSMTPISRRNFLHSTAAASAAALAPIPPQTQTLPALSALKPLGDRVRPITADEFHARLFRAQSLMAQSNPSFDAI